MGEMLSRWRERQLPFNDNNNNIIIIIIISIIIISFISMFAFITLLSCCYCFSYCDGVDVRSYGFYRWWFWEFISGDDVMKLFWCWYYRYRFRVGNGNQNILQVNPREEEMERVSNIQLTAMEPRFSWLFSLKQTRRKQSKVNEFNIVHSSDSCSFFRVWSYTSVL